MQRMQLSKGSGQILYCVFLEELLDNELCISMQYLYVDHIIICN